ncbi:MAG: HIT domain-containing protein [Candidatus Cloacimonadota bacterium]|nr:HIT domain-containing protein [Candidatus Cloacimonadota bacterium]
MNNILYSPWRIDYILSEKQDKCVFCFPKADDDKHFVVYRNENCYVILNHYPYNNGHIMVIPNRHVSNLNQLSEKENCELFSTVRLATKVLKVVYKCEGLNIGINEGKAAGAGIESHLHVHLLPRWVGDSNFMTTIAGTRVIPDSYENTFSQLKEQFDNETSQN